MNTQPPIEIPVELAIAVLRTQRQNRSHPAIYALRAIAVMESSGVGTTFTRREYIQAMGDLGQDYQVAAYIDLQRLTDTLTINGQEIVMAKKTGPRTPLVRKTMRQLAAELELRELGVFTIKARAAIGIRSFHQALYEGCLAALTAMNNQRESGLTISREGIKEILGIRSNAQIRWEREMGIEVRENIAIIATDSPNLGEDNDRAAAGPRSRYFAPARTRGSQIRNTYRVTGCYLLTVEVNTDVLPEDALPNFDSGRREVADQGIAAPETSDGYTARQTMPSLPPYGTGQTASATIDVFVGESEARMRHRNAPRKRVGIFLRIQKGALVGAAVFSLFCLLHRATLGEVVRLTIQEQAQLVMNFPDPSFFVEGSPK